MKTSTLLFTTCLLFASLVVACAPAPIVAPTTTPPATSTPQIVLITPTPWLVTATPAPTATPAVTATPTVVPGQFDAQTWAGSPDISTNALGIVWDQGDNIFHVVVTGDMLSGTDWAKYLGYSGWQPSDLRDLWTNAHGVNLSAVVSQAQGALADFLNLEINTDHHLDAQFASLWATFSAKHPNDQQNLSDKLYFVLGKGSDGKVWVVQVVDGVDQKKVEKYFVNPDVTLGEAAATPTPVILRTGRFWTFLRA